jgi:hypothetical protein
VTFITIFIRIVVLFWMTNADWIFLAVLNAALRVEVAANPIERV